MGWLRLEGSLKLQHSLCRRLLYGRQVRGRSHPILSLSYGRQVRGRIWQTSSWAITSDTLSLYSRLITYIFHILTSLVWTSLKCQTSSWANMADKFVGDRIRHFLPTFTSYCLYLSHIDVPCIDVFYMADKFVGDRIRHSWLSFTSRNILIWGGYD